MSLELSQLSNLSVSKRGSVSVGYLPPSVSAHLKCPLGIAYLSSSSLEHILRDHPDIKEMDMLCLPEMIIKGTWIADRKQQACVVYDDPQTGKRYKSAVKVAASGYEVYITTFHRCGDKQLKRIKKRGVVIK